MRCVNALRLLFATTVLGGLSPATQAAMSDNATTYGLLPSDVASAQAFSLFSDQVSATWYNPASLTRGPEGELTNGLFHGEPSLEVESQGGMNAPSRDGDVLNDTPTQTVVIGMKKDLSDLVTFDHPIYFGFLAGVEKFGAEMMAFESKTADEGQFLGYDRQPLFLNLGVGTSVWRGVDVGASLRITLHANASMNAKSDLAGNTEEEELEVSAEPKFTPVLGVNVALGETFCDMTPCFLDRFDTALVYRGYSKSKTNVNANAVIPGTIPEPGLDLAIQTIDSFQPAMASLGVRYRIAEGLHLGVAAEHQMWSRLEEDLEDDTIKDQAMLEFQDVVVPRLGVEYQFNDHLTLRSGLAHVESPLESERSEEVNYLDNDRVVLGLGGSLHIENPPILAYPLRLDFGYQYHHLTDRDFVLTGTNQNGDPYEERVTAGGEVHAVGGSFTVKF
jgi:long-chain fatty acid transport protein